MAGVGVCSLDEIALAVLAQVVTVQPARGRLIVDAGWTALSRDRATAAQSLDQHYGLVMDLAGQPLGDLVVTETSQEHGVVAARPGRAPETAQTYLASAQIGDRLLILPNHACATAGQHTAYVLYRAGGNVCARYPRVEGW